MAGRSKKITRCPFCRMHTDLCICAHIPKLDTVTRLVLIMHYREVRKPTATGLLALKALPNSERHIHGLREQTFDMADITNPERRLLVLYPGEDAVELSPEFLQTDPRPVTLIVPDGTWRQAVRMHRRLPGIDQAEMVTLAPGPPSEWTLRKAHTECRLSTYEAIARAYGILEGPQIQQALEKLFRLMVHRSLITKGQTEA